MPLSKLRCASYWGGGDAIVRFSVSMNVYCSIALGGTVYHASHGKNFMRNFLLPSSFCVNR